MYHQRLGLVLGISYLVIGVVPFYLNTWLVYICLQNLIGGQKLSPVTFMHLTIGLNNIASCCSRATCMLIWCFISYDPKLFSILYPILRFQTCFGYWLMAWLSAFYAVNITNFSHRLLVWIKRNLPSFVPYVLLQTGLVSLALSFFLFWHLKVKCLLQNPVNGTNNINLQMKNVFLFHFHATVTTIFSSCLPFINISISLLVTVSSLLKHVRNIGHTGSNIQVHIAAIKTMVMFLILSVLFYIMDMIIINYEIEENILFTMWLMRMVFPTMEAIIIIQSNPKLKNIFPRWSCARGTGDN